MPHLHKLGEWHRLNPLCCLTIVHSLNDFTIPESDHFQGSSAILKFWILIYFGTALEVKVSSLLGTVQTCLWSHGRLVVYILQWQAQVFGHSRLVSEVAYESYTSFHKIIRKWTHCWSEYVAQCSKSKIVNRTSNQNLSTW